MPEAIQVEGLTKVFTTAKDRPRLRAVDGIDFTVHEGEVFGFLGPNGAGKTSTLRMLTTFAAHGGKGAGARFGLGQRFAAHQEAYWCCAGSLQSV